ncbi:hypothetical protein BH10CHL1_BH10CHL1_17960 [soil metagenome]
MSTIKPPTTYSELSEFIASQLDMEGLTAAIDQASLVYEEAKARPIDLHLQLEDHDADRPTNYSYVWVSKRYEIVKAIVAVIEQTDQSRIALNKARANLWHARRSLLEKFGILYARPAT